MAAGAQLHAAHSSRAGDKHRPSPPPSAPGSRRCTAGGHVHARGRGRPVPQGATGRRPEPAAAAVHPPVQPALWRPRRWAARAQPPPARPSRLQHAPPLPPPPGAVHAGWLAPPPPSLSSSKRLAWDHRGPRLLPADSLLRRGALAAARAGVRCGSQPLGLASRRVQPARRIPTPPRIPFPGLGKQAPHSCGRATRRPRRRAVPRGCGGAQPQPAGGAAGGQEPAHQPPGHAHAGERPCNWG
jgi:hypothetical protein